MTTALDHIKRAYRLIGVYSIGETPDSAEANDGLTALNAILGSWTNEMLMIYANSLDNIPLVAGTAVYTIGPSGAVITARPTELVAGSYVDYLGVSSPFEPLTLDQYSAIAFKAATGIPNQGWLESNFENATLTVFPVPAVNCTLKLWSKKPFAKFATLITDIVLPDGYDDAISYNLAMRLAPENEVRVPDEVRRVAFTAKKLIKRTNTVVPVLGMPFGIPGSLRNRGFLA
jgi:hypothetical protein